MAAADFSQWLRGLGVVAVFVFVFVLMLIVGVYTEPMRNFAAKTVALDRHAAQVDARCGDILVAEYGLYVAQIAGLLTDETRHCVSGLMQVNMTEAAGFGITLQGFHKAV